MVRNLTHERQLAFLKRRKAEELALVGPTETVVDTIAKPGKGGAVEYVDRRISKREYLAREHDSRIAQFAQSHGLTA